MNVNVEVAVLERTVKDAIAKEQTDLCVYCPVARATNVYLKEGYRAFVRQGTLEVIPPHGSSSEDNYMVDLPQSVIHWEHALDDMIENEIDDPNILKGITFTIELPEEVVSQVTMHRIFHQKGGLP